MGCRPYIASLANSVLQNDSIYRVTTYAGLIVIAGLAASASCSLVRSGGNAIRSQS